MEALDLALTSEDANEDPLSEKSAEGLRCRGGRGEFVRD